MPGSSESGAVPNTSVIVPPDLPLVLLLLDELLFDELPHAASKIAAASASPVTATDLRVLLIASS
jgi:hypothetical protein